MYSLISHGMFFYGYLWMLSHLYEIVYHQMHFSLNICLHSDLLQIFRYSFFFLSEIIYPQVNLSRRLKPSKKALSTGLLVTIYRQQISVCE